MTARRPARTRGRSEEGFALFSVIALLLVSAIVFTTLTAYTVSEARESGRYRREGVALAAAEGQVDATVAGVTNGAASGALPCSPAPVTQTAGPDTVTVTTTISYYDSSPALLACPVPAGVTAATAVVQAAATGTALTGTLPVRRVIQAALRLTAQGGSGGAGTFPSAIFADQGITLSSSVTLTTGGTTTATTPDVRTNAAFTCSNSSSFPGSIYAQGSGPSTVSNQCRVAGNVATVGSVTVSNAGAVGTNLSSSAGNVTISNGGTVGGTTSARGTVTGCSARCFPNSQPAAPTPETLPNVTWDATASSAWQRAGWTVVTFDRPSDCQMNGSTNAPAAWLVNNANLGGGPVVLHTVCQLTMSNGVSVTMNRDVAVLADAGVAMTNSVTFNASAPRRLYLMQPANVVSRPCTTNSVNVGSGATFSSQLSILFYTPCSATLGQGGSFSGQLYAGNTVTVANGMTMSFAPLPVPGQGSGGGAATYAVAVTAKYESS